VLLEQFLAAVAAHEFAISLSHDCPSMILGGSLWLPTFFPASPELIFILTH